MSQQQLNNIMVLHIHKDKTDKLFMTDVANKFVNSEYMENLLTDHISTCCHDVTACI